MMTKEQKKIYMKKWRTDNKDRIIEWRIEYNKQNYDKNKEYKQREYVKIKNKEYSKKYKSNPDNTIKTIAHDTVNNAIKSGKLIKGPCYICGSTKRINCHHPDYNKPLDVIFLCPIHHSRLHKILKLIGG